MRTAFQFLSLLLILCGIGFTTMGGCSLLASVPASAPRLRSAATQLPPDPDRQKMHDDEGAGMMRVAGAASLLTGIVFLLVGFGVLHASRSPTASNAEAAPRDDSVQ